MEFNNLGKRCNVIDCNQLDYLPFQCKYCSKWHCSTHANDHDCKASNNQDKMVMICPVCSKKLNYSSNDDPNTIWTIHYNEECSKNSVQTNQKIAKNNDVKKPIVRCAYHRCPTKLTTVNKYNCSDCRLEYCNTHRLQEYHDCSNKYKNVKEAKKPVNLTGKAPDNLGLGDQCYIF